MSLVKNAFVKKGKKYGYVDATGKFTTGWVVVDNSQNLVRYINPDKKGFVQMNPSGLMASCITLIRMVTESMT